MAHAIASDLPILPGEHILEIGPGHGALTKHLLQHGESVTAIEIDPECAAIVQKAFADRSFSVIESDFMKFDLASWCAAHPKAWVAGNLPYNVATAILVRLVEQISHFRGIMAMVQYEVALRIAAQPGSSDYGSLSVFIASFCDRQILRKIGPEYFTPKPNVDSATVLLTPRDTPLAHPEGFFEFVQACFTHKRKRITNSLQGPWEKSRIADAIEIMGLTPNARAEELSPEQFLAFYTLLQKTSEA